MISTRTPHAGSDSVPRLAVVRFLISTRTPHAGSDAEPRAMRYRRLYFNPHSPCGE